MRILQIISSTGFFGAENAMIGLSSELYSTKYEPYVGIIGNSQNSHIGVAREAERNGLKVKIFHCTGKFNIGTILEIRKYIRERNIDIVHSHGYKSNFYGLLASSNTGARKICTCHNWLSNDMKMKFYELLDKLLLSKFDKVVVVSEELKREIARRGTVRDKIIVINNGIDMSDGRWKIGNSRNDKRRKFGIGRNEKVIGTVGRLTPEKGHIYLLEAFKKVITVFPDVNLVIIGDGPLRNSLKLKAESLKLEDKVIFTGIRNDVPEMLNMMDVFVMPSLKEGMPMALLEAMASKKPVIASKVGAIPKIIKDEINGLLIEPGNIDELNKAIIELLKDEKKSNLIAENGYTRVRNDFSSRKMASEYMKVYESLNGDGTVKC